MLSTKNYISLVGEFNGITYFVSMKERIHKLDKVFSEFVRLNESDDEGNVSCCYCDGLLHWQSANCCHFMKRSNMITRYNVQNCHAGHLICNKEDDHEAYALRIDLRYGDGTAEKLEHISKLTYHYSLTELDELIAFYQREVKRLKKIKNTQNLF